MKKRTTQPAGKQQQPSKQPSQQQPQPSQQPPGGGRGHPYGVQPWGNYYLAGQQAEIRTPGEGVDDTQRSGGGCRALTVAHPLPPPSCAPAAGLGLLSRLPDELLLDLLFRLPAPDLGRLGLSSKAAYVFAHTPELWKALSLEVRQQQAAAT